MVIASIALPAAAQDNSSFSLGDYDSGKRRSHKPPSDALADPSQIHLQGDRWPWLEPGAVVCGTEEDLEHYRADIAARLDGQPAPALAAGCRRLTRRTPIAVADRRGPATLEVHLYSDAKQVGWTDAYLPSQRPN
jgi:hypothetical protein